MWIFFVRSIDSLDSIRGKVREFFRQKFSFQHVKRNLSIFRCGNSVQRVVVRWGQIASLDAEQQVAFEILAATYILTFYDEPNNNLTADTEVNFMENKKRLMQLARREPAKTTPLRMYVTGPAGAGKCKEETPL